MKRPECVERILNLREGSFKCDPVELCRYIEYTEKLCRDRFHQIQEMRKELKELERRADSLAEFYGEASAWVGKTHTGDSTFCRMDVEMCGVLKLYRGGKAAREFIRWRKNNEEEV